MTYKHDALVRAWLNGETVQYRNGLLWVDMPSSKDAEKLPHFYQCDEYRLKPKVIRVRLALFRSNRVIAAHTLQEEVSLERTAGFVRWVSDWTEYAS